MLVHGSRLTVGGWCCYILILSLRKAMWFRGNDIKANASTHLYRIKRNSRNFAFVRSFFNVVHICIRGIWQRNIQYTPHTNHIILYIYICCRVYYTCRRETWFPAHRARVKSFGVRIRCRSTNCVWHPSTKSHSISLRERGTCVWVCFDSSAAPQFPHQQFSSFRWFCLMEMKLMLHGSSQHSPVVRKGIRIAANKFAAAVLRLGLVTIRSIAKFLMTALKNTNKNKIVLKYESFTNGARCSLCLCMRKGFCSVLRVL